MHDEANCRRRIWIIALFVFWHVHWFIDEEKLEYTNTEKSTSCDVQKVNSLLIYCGFLKEGRDDDDDMSQQSYIKSVEKKVWHSSAREKVN